MQSLVEGFFLLVNKAHVPVPDASERLQVESVTAVNQTREFAQQSFRNHCFAASVDKIVELGSVSSESDQKYFIGSLAKTVLPLPFTDRPPRQLIDLQR